MQSTNVERRQRVFFIISNSFRIQLKCKLKLIYAVWLKRIVKVIFENSRNLKKIYFYTYIFLHFLFIFEVKKKSLGRWKKTHFWACIHAITKLPM